MAYIYGVFIIASLALLTNALARFNSIQTSRPSFQGLATSSRAMEETVLHEWSLDLSADEARAVAQLAARRCNLPGEGRMQVASNSPLNDITNRYICKY